MDESSHRVVITGANRGLGLEFTRQALALGWAVVAGCRHPAEATALQALGEQNPGRLQVLALAVDQEQSRREFAAATALLHDGLELLVNNAGVLAPGERFGQLRAEVMAQSFATNVIAPVMLCQALAPLLARGRRPRVLNISSQLGSIAGSSQFGTPSYRISKAALNMAGVQLAQALNPMGIGVVNAHPGWVKTEMGGDAAPLSPQESVQGLLKLVQDLPGLPAGPFLDRDGSPLPW